MCAGDRIGVKKRGEKSAVLGSTVRVGDCGQGVKRYCVERVVGAGGSVARAAGTFVTVLTPEDSSGRVRVRFPSGSKGLLQGDCLGRVGSVGMEDSMSVVLGKAGKNRWLGRRSRVRGVAMNPVDHPLGGGEGKTSGGRPSVSPWGRALKGKKTKREGRGKLGFVVS